MILRKTLNFATWYLHFQVLYYFISFFSLEFYTSVYIPCFKSWKYIYCKYCRIQLSFYSSSFSWNRSHAVEANHVFLLLRIRLNQGVLVRSYARCARRKKRGSVTYSKEWENKAIKIFIISLGSNRLEGFYSNKLLNLAGRTVKYALKID